MRRTTSLLLTSLACAVAAHAQASQTSGSIKGLVSTKKGEFIETGKVVARNLETGFTRSVNIEALGYYTMPLLPLGPYRITVTSPGMKTAEINVRVSLGQNSVVNVDLEPIEAQAVVEIVGQANALDTTQVNSFTAIDQKLVEAVPINGRDFTNLVALTPGSVPDPANGRIAMGGARGIMNNLTIDGASYNSTFFGEQRGSTRIPYTFGADTIKELQVITNAFDAQYNAGGAVINAVTKSGTNEFEGSALAQWRPSQLVSRVRTTPFDNSSGGVQNSVKARTRDFTQVISNVNFGGPILKDKLFFFVGVEAYHYQEGFTPNYGVGSSTSLNSPAKFATWMSTFGKMVVGNDGHTIADEGGLGYTSDRKNLVVFARMDWTINENHRATLRVNSQDLKWANGTSSLTSPSTANTGVSQQGLEKDSGLSWVLEFNSVFGSNWVNEARVQRAIERRPRFANSTASPELTVSSGFFTGQNNFLPNGLDEYTWQFIDNLTWTSGDLTIKGGVDHQLLTYANTFYRYQNGSFQFANYDAANRWAAGTLSGLNSDIDPLTPGVQVAGISYQGAYSKYGGTIGFGSRQTGLYLQSTYQGFLNHRLTLDVGVRYNREAWDHNPRPNPVFQGLDQAPTKNSMDPRIGFSYDVFGDSKTVLRGGYGEFSIYNPALTVSNTMNSNGETTSTYLIRNSVGNAPLFAQGGVLGYNVRVTPDGRFLSVLPAAILTDPLQIPGSAQVGQLWDPNNKLSKKKLTALGVEQDLGHGLVAGVRGEYAEFQNLQYFVDVNLTQQGGGIYNDGYPTALNKFTAARPASFVVRGHTIAATAAGFGDVFLSENNGQGDYKAIIFTFSRKIEQGWGFTSNLTWAKDLDNNSNERTTASLTADSYNNNPANPLANLSPSDADRRFRGVFAGYFPLQFGIQGSAIFTYTTGKPYSAFVGGTDLNGDGSNANDYVPGTTRNQFRQPHVKTLDMRFTRDFHIAGKFSLEGQIDVFNVLNWANWTTGLNTNQPSNGTFSSTFGRLNNPDRSTREVQFGLRARW